METHQEVLLFCFLPIIQNDPNEFYQTWNRKNIRQSVAAAGARPDLLFSTPETVGFTHQGVKVDVEDLDLTVKQLGISETPYCRNEQLHELLSIYVHLNDLNIPVDAFEGLELYEKLLDPLKQDEFEV